MDVRASDAERDAAVQRLRDAAAEGRLTLEELTDRIEAASGAVTREDLAPLTSDLPEATAVGHVVEPQNTRAVGDIKRTGAWTVPAANEFRTWFGNITLDLREARIVAAETTIHARVGMGNVVLLVPEGVEVHVHATTQIGRSTHDLGPVAPGAPRIVLAGGTFFGDIKVRHRRLWDRRSRRGARPASPR
jgi:hypothetical protein